MLFFSKLLKVVSLTLEIKVAIGLRSNPIAFLSLIVASSKVDPDPQKGSKTTSVFFEYVSIKHDGICGINFAGYGCMLWVR